MEIDPQCMPAPAVYKLLIGCIVPRPIAWVSTVGADGVKNVAPFSFFMGVCNDPPTLAFSAGPRSGATGGDYPPEVDEFRVAALTAAPSVKVRAPRVGEAPISMECRVAQILRVGRGPHSLVLGEIVYFHLRDDLYDQQAGRIDMHRLKPVGRLAGEMYTHIHDLFELKRPVANYAG